MDYLSLFSNWLDQQFIHKDEELHKKYILDIVSNKYLPDYSGDYVSLYRLASKDLQKQLWT